MANSRHIACLLALLALVGFNHGQSINGNQGPTDFEHNVDVEIQAGSDFTTTTKVPIGSQSQIADKSSTENSTYKLLEYMREALSSIDRTHLIDGNGSVLTCEDWAALTFHDYAKNVKVAGVLFDLVTVTFLVINGCNEQTVVERLREIEDAVGDKDAVDEAIKWTVQSLLEYSSTGHNRHQRLLPLESHAIIQQAKHIVSQIRTLQARPDNSMTGRWRCAWREISVPSELFCTDKDTLYTVVDGKVHIRDLSSFVSAKLACEDMESKCEGILEVSTYDYTQYEVIKSGSGTQCPTGNSRKVWEKHCESNDAKYSENAERKIRGQSRSRTKRRANCNDPEERELYRAVENVPVANFLYSFISSLAYDLNGCRYYANMRFRSFARQLGENIESAKRAMRG